ncbi:MAG TPA: hypothetical protein VE974_24860 [Thermoanaerobaculia bacterium]|nr:hypothetical protein [Thermoanaerobaculia bacterium]
MKALLLVCVASLAFATASARPLERQIIGAEQDRTVAAGGDDCESFFRTTFSSFAAQARAHEQRELDLSGVQQIRVAAAPEGGISIRGWNRSGAKLVICRYAAANTQEHATRALGAIHVSSRNGEIAVQGPQMDAKQAWWVNMTLYVPRRANVDVRAGNGAVAIRNMSGRVSAESATGGISIAQSSGKYSIRTDSGGITLDRVTGLVDAVSRGGAIAFKLAGTALPSIEAKTGEGHIVCTLKGCEEATPTGGGGNRLRIGDGVPDVRLSSMGGSIWIGPVTY